MPLQIKPSSGSGSATLISVAGTTTNDTLTLPAKTGNIITSADSGTVTQTMLGTGVAGNGPAFSAYQSSAQSLTSNTFTKLQIATERFDTANCYDTSLYRFTPNVAGYYLVIGTPDLSGTNLSATGCAIYKNGSIYQYGTYVAAVITEFIHNVTAIIYMNGTSDYVELYGLGTVTSGSVSVGTSASSLTNFSANLIRGA